MLFRVKFILKSYDLILVKLNITPLKLNILIVYYEQEIWNSHMSKVSRFKDVGNNSKADFSYLERLEIYFKNSVGTDVEKLQNFAKYVPRQDLTNFLAKYELFKKILYIPGYVIECGILFGGGLLTFAQLSAIFEPTNFERKIIGFDTFKGLTKISTHDTTLSPLAYEGSFSIDSYDDLMKCRELYDSNRFLGHINKIEIIKGNSVDTIPTFIDKNPATMISLLYLDFLLYEPTKVALENFLPRMPKGSIIAFNTLTDQRWPGTMKAMLNEINFRDIKFERFSFNPYVQYAIL